ncbi:hypothetical protein B0H10DRAFT_2201617 [Mycena sp. CBHHK59/15]|nr:hypothetical protein B0H10DRAFT_2201617 [Mycena sp. CBHHK59/15]
MYYHEELKDLLHLLKHLPDTIPIGKDHDFEGFAVDGKAADELGCIKTVVRMRSEVLLTDRNARWGAWITGRKQPGARIGKGNRTKGVWASQAGIRGRLALIPGFIIFTSPFLIGMQEIHIIDTDAVANHWASFDGINHLPVSQSRPERPLSI